MPIGVSQEVGGGQLHLKNAWLRVEGERKCLKVWWREKREVISWLVPGLPLLEELATDLCAQMRV